MTESEFNQQVDDTLISIEESLDELDLDIDYETSGGILTITLENGSKIIINRQTPVKQLWLAAKDGGYHLDWVHDQWITDKDKEPLEQLLSRVMTQQSGQSVSFTL